MYVVFRRASVASTVYSTSIEVNPVILDEDDEASLEVRSWIVERTYLTLVYSVRLSEFSKDCIMNRPLHVVVGSKYFCNKQLLQEQFKEIAMKLPLVSKL